MNDRDRDAADDWMRDHMPSEEALFAFHRKNPSGLVELLNPGRSAREVDELRFSPNETGEITVDLDGVDDWSRLDGFARPATPATTPSWKIRS